MSYTIGDVIGEGGMGEVLRARDMVIGRDVALKRLRSNGEAEVAQFMRAARIQARLEHPAIVPVYELAKDDDGRPYFAMKLIAGRSLRDHMVNKQRALRAFADVCRAIEYAHSRGVVHRDLKPSNIVLGEFGEVYVLDWGEAAVSDGTPPPHVGTPGYMAPEQREHNSIESPIDIFALGAILFEILSGEPLGEAYTERSPGKRRPDAAVPPELDAMCVAATARDPKERPTARRLADQVEQYLDGDRDVARRRGLAGDLVWTARAALDDGRRGDAMAAAGRALALDPNGTDAAELVTRMMLEPPAKESKELSQAIDEATAVGVKKHAKTAIAAYGVLAAFLPFAAWNGIRDWSVVLGVFGFSVAMGLFAWRIYVKPHRSLPEMLVYAVCNAALLVMLSRMAGPFTFVPGLVCFMTMSTMSYPAFVKRPLALIGTMVIGFATPIVLERLGVLRSTWDLGENGGLCSHANALALHGTPTVVLIIAASMATIVMAGVHSAAIAKANRAAEVRLVSQAWHLSQLLPRVKV